MNKITDTYILNNHIKIPCVGFGTWQTPDDEVGYNAVKVALEAGYRHIDTAAGYGNEDIVGKAIKDSGIPREEIFVTTKLANSDRGYEETLEAFNISLTNLGLDYVDLYLIHWPNPAKFRDNFEEMLTQSWKAMETLYEKGLVKAIGVSNFKIHHLEVLLKSAKIIPAVNQIKLCPGVHPDDLIDYCQTKNILLQAYSPLGTGTVLQMPEMKKLAASKKASPAAVSLKWCIEKGFNPLPKSVTPERIIQNSQFMDVTLTPEDIAFIDAFDTPENAAKDPDKVPF